MAEEEEEEDKESSFSKALAWHNLKFSPECVSCFEDLSQSYVCDWCCVAEDLHAVFQRDGCWIGDGEQKKKEAIGEMFLHVHIKLSSQMIDFCRIHFDRWTTLSLSCATLLGHKCSASRFQHNANARNKVREKVSLSCFEQPKVWTHVCDLQVAGRNTCVWLHFTPPDAALCRSCTGPDQENSHPLLCMTFAKLDCEKWKRFHQHTCRLGTKFQNSRNWSDTPSIGLKIVC